MLNNSLNNHCNNYSLYIKVFNNVYISNLIYSFVNQINNSIVSNYSENNNNKLRNIFKKNYKNQNKLVYKYNEIPFDIIFENNLLNIFIDRIKTKTISKDSIDLLKFTSFIKTNPTIDFIIIKEFYQLNKIILLNNYQENYNLFTMVVKIGNLEFLKFIYQDQKESIDLEKENYYGHSKNDINSPLKIYFNTILPIIAFEKSSIEIIKFLIDTVQIDIYKYFPNNEILFWSIESKNRNQLIDYICDELNYKYTSKSDDYNLFFANPKNLLYFISLNFKTFKKLSNDTSLYLKLFSAGFHNIIFKEIEDFQNGQFGSEELNSILIIIYSYYKLTDNSQFFTIYKKIKQIIKYNSNQIDEDNFTTTLNQNNNKESIVSKIISNLFINEKLDIDFKNKYYCCPELKEYSILNYKDFNFEKEIKKIYIFQFLNLLIKNNFMGDGKNINQYLTSSLISYSFKFQEYQIVEKYLKLKSDLKEDIEKQIYSYIILRKDNQAYIHSKKNSLINRVQKIDKDFKRLIVTSIESNNDYQDLIEILYSFYQFNDSLFELLLIELLKSDEIKIESIQRIMMILNNYYKKNKYEKSEYFKCGDSINRSFIFKNYKDLFRW